MEKSQNIPSACCVFRRSSATTGDEQVRQLIPGSRFRYVENVSRTVVSSSIHRRESGAEFFGAGDMMKYEFIIILSLLINILKIPIPRKKDFTGF
jgi:hypothetical protein